MSIVREVLPAYQPKWSWVRFSSLTELTDKFT